MVGRKKRWIYGIILLAIVGGTILIARAYILHKIREKLIDKVHTLNESDLKVHYDTIYLDWKRNIITIEKLVIEKDSYDTSCVYPEFVSAAKAEIKGLGILSLLFRKELSIDEVIIQQPHLVLHKPSTLFADSTAEKETSFAGYIERILLDSAKVEILDSASCKLDSRFRGTLEVNDLDFTFKPSRPFDLTFSTVDLKHTIYDLPSAYYTFRTENIRIDLQDHSLVADTIRIIPSFGRYQFGNQAGFDIDRIEGVLPFVKLHQFNAQFKDTFFIDAASAEIQMFLKVFHDKRLPHRQRFVRLPIDQLRELTFGLNIDTLFVRKSYIEYVEFPAEATEPGKVYFDNVMATLFNVTNDFVRNEGRTMMEAKADFMGEGNLHVKTIFPWDREDECRLEGSLTGLSFNRLNEMVEPAANIKFESGRLSRIDFNFSYNQKRSRGQVELNYENLKLTSLKDDDAGEKEKEKGKRRKKKKDEKDNFKTFVINAFLIRKNMDEKVPEEKRTGEISWERDTTRSVFNYWWKSLFTGIKSAFNLDKLEARAEKRKGRHK